jgi:putative membrane-bound dehydrogenase-like protein
MHSLRLCGSQCFSTSAFFPRAIFPRAIFPWAIALAIATGFVFPVSAQKVYDSQEETVPKYTPEQSVATAKLPPGFRLQVAASEPDVQQPIAMAWDVRGRLWVAENYTYAESSKKFDMDLSDRILVLEDTDGDGTFDKRKVFYENLKELTSIEVGNGGIWALASPRLVFIPDRDNDDVPDQEPITVLDGFNPNIRHNFANGLRFGPDGWLYGRHGILGSSDVEYVGPQANSPLTRGVPVPPAGYGVPLQSQSATTPQKTRLHCGVWRYHPVTHKIEMVSEGTTNPWGMDWDAHGNLFFINTVIGHLWHAIPGAHLQRMYGEDSDPTVYELLPQIADHVHWDEKGEDWRETRKGPPSTGTDAAGGGHAHSGLMIYQADQWPKEYRNQIFTLNLHGRRINRDRLERQGAGFVGKHDQDMVFWEDPWFRGLDLTTAPDGSVLVIDWSDIGECHDDDGVHRTSGRIYRISYDAKDQRPYQKAADSIARISKVGADLVDAAKKQAGNGPVAVRGLTVLRAEEVSEIKEHPNAWFANQLLKALRLNRPDSQIVKIEVAKEMLNEAIRGANRKGVSEVAGTADAATQQLRLLQLIEASGEFPTKQIYTLLLSDQREAIHAWAIRTLAERYASMNEEQQSEATAEVVDFLKSKTIDKISPLVRLNIAALLPRFGDEPWRIASILAGSEDLANDRDFSLVLWYSLRHAIVEDPMKGAKLALASQLPKLTELIIRRLASEPADEAGAPSESYEALSYFLADVARKADAKTQEYVIRGLWEAYQGRKNAKAPQAWDELANKAKENADESTRQKATLLQAVFSGSVAAEDLIALASDAKVAAAARRSAIESLGNLDSEAARTTLWNLVNDQNFGGVAALAIGKTLNAESAKRLVDLYSGAWPPGKSGIVSALGGKRETLPLLLDAIEQKKIPSENIDASTWRQFMAVADWDLLQRARTINPTLGVASDKKQTIESMEQWLTDEVLQQADAGRGKTVWNNVCAQCHKLFGEGGAIGPELTGGQRTNKRYWLENIVAPSAVVASSFQVTYFLTDEGSVITGVPVSENVNSVTVQTAKEKIVLSKNEITERRKSELSLMPEGLIDPLSPELRADLFKYLMSPVQVTAK